jgi:hypothetical protein
MPITMVFSNYFGTPTIMNQIHIMCKDYEHYYMYNPFMICQKKYNPFTTLDGK